VSERNDRLEESGSAARGPVRFLLKVLGAMIALVVLAIVAFNLYLSGRPEAKTVKLVAAIRTGGDAVHHTRKFLSFSRSFPAPG